MARWNNIFLIDTRKVQKFFFVPKFDSSRWMVLSIREIAFGLYYIGILLVFLTSLSPWFLWSLYFYGQFVAFVPIVSAFLLSRTLSRPLFTRKDYIYPIFTYILCVTVMDLLSGRNMNGFIGDAFNAVVFLSLFMLNLNDLVRLGNMLAKTMGLLLVPSILFYVLYLCGYSLPHYHIVATLGHYSFENYRFFLLDDRFATQIIPRFHSVFLEPAHLAIVCVALLLAQVGRWERWYNIVIFLALIMSFSLAGYVLMVAMLFGASWIKRQAIIRKILALLCVCAVVTIVSVFYNDGENLINNLIIQRLDVKDDGRLEGDNRVSESFEKVYDHFAQSDRFLFGEGYDKYERYSVGGNAGYRVFFYINGFISFIFLVVFYLTFSAYSRNTRAKWVMFMIASMSFIAHAIPLKYYFFIPLYILVFREVENEEEKQHAVEGGRV